MRRKLGALALGMAVAVGGTVWAFRAAYVPPILMYHAIDELWRDSKLSVAPRRFAWQMQYLHDHRYRVLSLAELVDIFDEGHEVPPRTVVLTFDDGLENFYTAAFPILRQHHYPVALFVIVNDVGQPGYLTWEQIREMDQAGITIGSHTLTHPWLPVLPDDQLRHEIVDSKRILEKHLGHAVDFFAYPMGGTSLRVRRMVRAAGYYGACATNPGRKSNPINLFALKRIRVSRTADEPLVFWIQTSGWYTWIKEHRDSD